MRVLISTIITNSGAATSGNSINNNKFENILPA